MRHLLVIIVLIVLLPTIVIIFGYNKKEEKEYKFDFVSNSSVRVLRNDTKGIIQIPIEEYILGVLCGEVPVLFHKEALKAQAIAARSYVLYKMQISKDLKYDVIDTVKNQVYVDTTYLKSKWGNKYNEYIKKMSDAVKETQGIYASYNNKVADTLYFSTSSGYTENSEEIFVTRLPYLVSVESKYDKDESPVFNEVKEFTKDVFYNKLGLDYSNTLKFEVTKKTSIGRNINIIINGTKMKASNLTSKLGLRSSYFTILESDSHIRITTTGYGHGVGMSQYGANGMAKHGSTYEEILKHYYTGITLKKL
ncbi:MAG: stage II sporulation protein D [Bacilli bacterium]